MRGTYKCNSCHARFKATRKQCGVCGTAGIVTDRETCPNCGTSFSDSRHQQCQRCGADDVELVARG